MPHCWDRDRSLKCTVADSLRPSWNRTTEDRPGTDIEVAVARVSGLHGPGHILSADPAGFIAVSACRAPRITAPRQPAGCGPLAARTEP